MHYPDCILVGVLRSHHIDVNRIGNETGRLMAGLVLKASVSSQVLGRPDNFGEAPAIAKAFATLKGDL